MILVGLSGLRQLEHGHFGPDVEAHLREMSDTSVDVETTVAGELYFTSYVSPIPHRQERRRQERRRPNRLDSSGGGAMVSGTAR